MFDFIWDAPFRLSVSQPQMPPLVYCAASALLDGDAKGNKRQHRSGSRQASSQSSGSHRISSALANPLLERYLLQQSDGILLREDLRPLRRAGLPNSSEPVTSWTLPTTCDSDFNGGDVRSSLSAAQNLIQVPGLTFSDYVWARSAIQRMRIEAMYI